MISHLNWLEQAQIHVTSLEALKEISNMLKEMGYTLPSTIAFNTQDILKGNMGGFFKLKRKGGDHQLFWDDRYVRWYRNIYIPEVRKVYEKFKATQANYRNTTIFIQLPNSNPNITIEIKGAA